MMSFEYQVAGNFAELMPCCRHVRRPLHIGHEGQIPVSISGAGGGGMGCCVVVVVVVFANSFAVKIFSQ